MKEYVHFCCTSEDINNIAYSMMLTDAKNNVMLKNIDDVVAKLTYMAHEYSNVSMLSRTHG
jgi:adenylosuccinate lyase